MKNFYKAKINRYNKIKNKVNKKINNHKKFWKC